ncbi:FHA domain-containing protein [Nocardioides humilatus]|uniref:FHA domain-containing protein n=1 Tax=Nocardioides humilatus TaxID=2607660 RepID=A0A5B1L5Z8_9ACTN|nr:adenylate/guanylate cyclase domain-containing protein [Nocardioides humilatus]KAA1415944.1 FHA domain-containing protein [Nocardioides humilatus]
MSELSQQRLAMLFSDIEGSTLVANRLGDQWKDVLRLHRETCRRAWAAHQGHEVDTAGDGFFVVFGSVEDAVAAALQAQRELAAVDWPGGQPIRSRMGLHIGMVSSYDGSYVGYDVHRAARIMGTANGGQVVASQAVIASFPRKPDGIEFTDLGRHPLKDLAEEERLFQIHAEGMLSSFPRIKSLGTSGAAAAVIARTLYRPAAVSNAELIMDDGRSLTVNEHGLRIGRMPDNDLVLTDTLVSRHHCAITGTPAGFVLTDLQSTHGTTVNGEEVTMARPLVDGDEVVVGATSFRFTQPG